MNKYVVEKVVGEGSFGKALLCRRKADQRKCIVKQISLKKMSRKEAAQTEQESQLLARLKHPNIVTFWESFSEPSKGISYLWIVMDFADGGDLDHLLKARRGKLMPESQAMQLFVQIALAMKHVHDRKILHRDLKTQNIFLTKGGIVKLGDFGIARVLRNTGELAATQIGTPYYMSPEIMNNKRYNSKTDIWSLGCVLYELLALKVPFEGNSMPALVRNIVSGQFRPLSTQYSQPVRDLVKAMLTKDPKHRPGINSVLNQPAVRTIISKFLDHSEHNSEFSHTVLHGEHILKKAPLPVDPVPGLALAAPTSTPSAVVPVVAAAVPVPPPSVDPRRPASREAGAGAVVARGNGEIERLRLEAEKMRQKMDQMAKDRNAVVEAERKRLGVLREKERAEIHKMQLEKESRDRQRREENARKLIEHERKRAADAARHIREAKEAADRRREGRDRPWAQQPAGGRKHQPSPSNPMHVAGAAANPSYRAAPSAWQNNDPLAAGRRPAQAPSPSNAVRGVNDPSPRNRNHAPGAAVYSNDNGGDDAEQYMVKLRERLKAKDDDRRRDKQAELSKLREKEKLDREAREKDRLERARVEKEKLRVKEQRVMAQKELDRERREEMESRVREERRAERQRQEDIRIEKSRQKAIEDDARNAEKKRVAAEQMAAEKDRLRVERDKLAKRLEDRERDRERREQERVDRLGGGEGGTPVPVARGKAAVRSRGGNDSDSTEDGASAVSRVKAAGAGRYAQQPSPGGGGKKRGALNLDWLSNLEDEMGQLQGQMEKMSPHVRDSGGNMSPHVGGGARGGTPQSAGHGNGKNNLQFVRKNERQQGAVGAVYATPSPSSAAGGARSRQKPTTGGAKSPAKPSKERSVSEKAPPPQRGDGRGKVCMSVDDLAPIPPWRKKSAAGAGLGAVGGAGVVKAPVAGGGKKRPQHGIGRGAPPGVVGESASVASLDDRRDKRDRDRADFKKFLIEKQRNVPKKRPVDIAERKPNPEWVFDLEDKDNSNNEIESGIEEIPLPREEPPVSSERAKQATAAATHLELQKGAETDGSMGLSITIENSNAVRDAHAQISSGADSTDSGAGSNSIAEAKTSGDSDRVINSAEKKKPKAGLSKFISNIFGPKKKIIPGVSPKVRLLSPKIKTHHAYQQHISSPNKKSSKAKSPSKDCGATPAWMLRDSSQGDSKGNEMTVDSVIVIENDPHSWSSEGMCGDLTDYTIATGPMVTGVGAGDDLAASSEYQDLLDSMRLALEDVNPGGRAGATDGKHNKKNKNDLNYHPAAVGAGQHMDVIAEESGDLDSSKTNPNPNGFTPMKNDSTSHSNSVSDDETFEESSVSLSDDSEEEGDSCNEGGSDWSVDNGSDVDIEGRDRNYDQDKVGDLPTDTKARGAKPLSHFVSHKIKDEKIGSRALNAEFSMETNTNPKGKDVSPGLKSTLYGVPISLSTSMKKEMSNLSSYGPSVRIETLRIVLEDRLGEKPFLSAYRYLKSVKDRVPLEDEAAEDAEEEKLLEDMERMLGMEGLRYLDLLYELITAEENF